jgi:glycosyltransferase involved in cell wall biosynthesis
MLAEERDSFSFLVLAYNHQDYIVEHLESIKFLVQTFGSEVDVDLIINDDGSRDRTRELAERWLALNSACFRRVETLYRSKNVGTCASVDGMLATVTTKRCKITAADDVYSCENIFELTRHGADTAMVSGRPLYLLDGSLGVDRMVSLLGTVTEIIYRRSGLLHRFKHFSHNNAPNLLYCVDGLLDPQVREYLRRFDVVEDWPIQIAIARRFPERKHVLLDEVLVYYRRTSGSTYLVANKRFVKDKSDIYDDLIAQDRNWLERQRLSSRKWSFLHQRFRIARFLNLDLYFFVAAVAVHLLAIVRAHRSVNLHENSHQSHYLRIRESASRFLQDATYASTGS